jgi:hypothetical protein
MDSNHDIVPTLRMFDGLMMNKAADEIERLRALLAEKTAAQSAVVLDAERSVFEVWMRDFEGYPYAGQYANLMWKAWQARAASPQATAFEWPPLPALPNQGFYAFDQALFTEHQMQGYANAYGEAVRVAMATATQPAQTERAQTERALTAAEIEKGWRKTFSTDNPYCPCNLKSFTKAVRWAEWTLTATQPASGADHAD